MLSFAPAGVAFGVQFFEGGFGPKSPACPMVFDPGTGFTVVCPEEERISGSAAYGHFGVMIADLPEPLGEW